MSEFFLELFSEEIPVNLQKNARETLLQNFKDFFEKKGISFKKEFSFSTPNRLLLFFDFRMPFRLSRFYLIVVCFITKN